MAEQKEKKSASQSARDAAGSIKDAAKLTRDIGRIFAGDMSAIKDVLMNKLFWEIVLVVALIVAAVGMIIGASITGVIQFLATSWTEHWDENKIDQAIQSNGDMTYFKTAGWIFTLTETFKDVVKDTFSTLTRAGIAAANGRDNSNLTDQEALAAGKNPEADDYENTMQAILTDDPENGIGLTPALKERLDMIIVRVKQRGIQLRNAAYDQYVTSRKSDYHDLADILTDEMEKKMDAGGGKVVMYAGFNDELSRENFKFDMSAFTLSKLQALKILAIFSIQHDCQLTEMDIWTLMEYCGWFDPKNKTDLHDTADSIYDEVLQDQRYGNDIGSVTKKNLGIPIAAFEMGPLQVPYWSGSCAPQWYYEQQALIREHNRQYLAYWESGDIPEEMIPWGIQQPNRGSNTYTISGVYAREPSSTYNEWFKTTTEITYTFEIVQVGTAKKTIIADYTPNQDIVVKDLAFGYSYLVYRNTYSQMVASNGNKTKKELVDTLSLGKFTLDEAYTEDTIDTALDLSQFQQLSSFKPYGIVDRLYYSAENNLTVLRNEYSSTESWDRETIKALGQKVYKYWDKYVWAREKNDGGGVVTRNDAGIHSYSYSGSIPSGSTVPSYDQNGYLTKMVQTSYSCTLYKKTSFWGGWTYVSGGGRSYSNLEADTSYRFTITKYTTTTKYEYTYDDEGNVTGTVPQKPTNSSSTHTSKTFTTFPKRLDTQAYELYAGLNVSFKARTVDEIAFELLGIWPGRLDDTVQVVRATKENNLVGVNEEGNYSYCLRESNMTGLASLMTDDLNKLGDAVRTFFEKRLKDLPLMCSRTVSKSDELPLTVVTWKVEYCINKDNPLTRPDATPNTHEGWRSVEADNGHLVFDIVEDGTYYAYCRITQKTEVLYSDSTTSETTEQFLFTIDVIAPNGRGFGSEYYKDTEIEDGALYADGHLGNEKMLLNWQDIYTDPEGTEHTLDFTRMTGYQYESYVDMVMALCELLGIDYEDWDPAVKRAKEIGWEIS